MKNIFTKKTVALLVIALVTLAVTLPLVLTACDNNPAADEKTLIVGTTTVITSLNRLDAQSGGNPGYNYDVLSGTVSQLAPVAKTTEGTFLPLLTDYTANDDGSWTFTVREGFTWHDGTPVTADDLSFTFAQQFGYPDPASDISAIETLSATSVRITLRTPDPRFLNDVVAMRVMPRHIVEGKTAETLTDEESVIGCGPFEFESWDTASNTMTFTKYADYPYADEVSFEKVIFKFFSSEDVMHLSLKSGEIDMEWKYSDGLSPAAEKDFADEENITLDSFAGQSYPLNLFFNNKRISDERVRKAIALAIDYAQIRTLFGTSFASASYAGFASPSTVGYISTPELSRDLDAAKALLREAGYSESRKFSFTLLVRSDGEYPEVAKVLETQIKETGLVSLTIDTREAATTQSIVMAGEHDAYLIKLTAFGVDNQGGLGSMYFGTTGNVPAGQVDNAEFNAIVTALQTATTEAEYLAAAADFQNYCVTYTPAISLMNDSVVQAYSSALSGFNKDGTFGLLNVLGWQTLKKSAK